MEITRESKLTSEENGVLEEFFDFYSKKETIVADSYKEGYHVLPFKGAKLAYQPDDYSWKSVDFSKKIVSNQKTYSVYLDLCRERYHNASKLLTIRQFRIVTPETHHILEVPSNNPNTEHLVYKVLETFDESKIMSPEQAYFERLYNVNKIPELIEKHEWETISKGIDDICVLGDELFVMGEPKVNEEGHKVDFGTILYQLINYRIKNMKYLNETALKELDRLIYKLRESELLGLSLSDSLGTTYVWPQDGMIDPCQRVEGYRSSEVFSVENGRLAEQNQVLQKVLRRF